MLGLPWMCWIIILREEVGHVRSETIGIVSYASAIIWNRIRTTLRLRNSMKRLALDLPSTPKLVRARRIH